MTLAQLLLMILFCLVLFLILLLHVDGFVVSHLFPAADIGVAASSVAVAVVLGVIVLQVEKKIMPTTMTMATTNEMSQCGLHPTVQSPSEGGKGQGR